MRSWLWPLAVRPDQHLRAWARLFWLQRPHRCGYTLFPRWRQFWYGEYPALERGRTLLFVHLRRWRWQPAWQKWPPGDWTRKAGGSWEYVILGPVTIRYVYGDYGRGMHHFWEDWK